MADFTTYTHPEIGSVQQEANTAILPDVSDKYLRAAQVKYAMDEAERQRKQKQIADDMAMFNFDTKGVWSRDVNAINDQINAGIKKFKNIDWLKRYNSGDMTAMQEYSDFLNGVNASIDKSKKDEFYYWNGMKEINQNSKYQNPTTLNAFDQFSKTPLSPDIPQFQIEHYSPLTLPTALSKFKTKTSIEFPTVGNQTKSIATQDYIEPTSAMQQILQDYNSNTEARNGFTSTLVSMLQDPNQANDTYPVYDINNPHWKQVTENGQSFFVNEPIAQKKLTDMTPQEAYVSFNYEPLSKVGIQQGLEGAQSSLSNGSNLIDPKKDWIINYAKQLKNGELQGTTVLDDNGKNVGIRYDLPSDYFETDKLGKEKKVVGIIESEGKYYKLYASDAKPNAAGKYNYKTAAWKNADHEITTMWNDMIAPYHRKIYGTTVDKDLNIAADEMWADPKLQQIAKDLGAPPPMNGSNQQSGSGQTKTTYSFNGKTFTKSQIENAAKSAGLSFDEYVAKYGIK